MLTATEKGACPNCGSSLPLDRAVCPRCGSVPRKARKLSTAPSASSVLLRIVVALFLFAGLTIIAIFAYLNITLLQSDVYKTSLQTAVASEELQNALGTNIGVKLPVLGYQLPAGDSNFAEWSVPLVGSHGSGHLYAVATEINGTWDFSRLAFASADGRSKIDLTTVHPLRLPLVPAKNVYLVPIGLAENESVDWAPAFYKAKLGIELKLLPAVDLDPKLIDPGRQQLNSDKCIEFLAGKYPDLARDPATILVAVTSTDMFIPHYGWSYAENKRSEGRYAVISSARLHPFALLAKWNPEWLTSRLQKLLTKNLLMMYFDLPMSSDYSSVLSGGVLSGFQIDQMGGEIIGAEGKWDSFVNWGGPAVSIYDGPGDQQLWKMERAGSPLPDTSSQVFCTDGSMGIMVQRKADFLFQDDPNLNFTRVYRNLDDRSRAFGVGGTDSFEIFLTGTMGVAIDLFMEDGVRVHFDHQNPKLGQTGDVYLATWGSDYGHFNNAKAIYTGTWQVKTTDGWIYTFPCKPQALPQNVTVLTGFTDPSGREYKMERDSVGALNSISSPTGNWLHFENDSQHHIRKITSSQGRTVDYDYGTGGRMIRATDSEGHVDVYGYDDRGQMLTASHGDDKPVLTNEYFPDGSVKTQTLKDGKSFVFWYSRTARNILRESTIKNPNGLETYYQYGDSGYIETLPAYPPQ